MIKSYKFSLITVFISLLFTTSYGQKATRLLLNGAKVVDVKNGILLEQAQDILIVGERISKIGPVGTIKSKKATIVDVSGQYIIPGLWDMHTHPDDPEVWWMHPEPEQRDQLMPLFVLFGVTGTRDMAGDLELVEDWRKRIRAGSLIGPEIIAAGPLIDGPKASWDGSVSIFDEDRVKFIVDSLKQAGVDFLKIYSGLPRNIFFPLAAYAKEIGFPLVGHIPDDVSTAEGAKAGMICQEHLLGILLECSTEEDNIRNKNIDYGAAENGIDRYVIRNKLMLDNYNREKAQALFKEYVKYNTWHTPTLSMWFKNAYYEEEAKKDSAYFKYLPQYLQKYWQPETNVHLRYRQDKIVETKRRLVEYYLTITGEMHRAGVKLLAGTDVGANPLCWPGIGVHNELEMFVQAGLSPAEALKTATINPTNFLEIDQDFGSIEVGKIADLVILKGNPLEDIKQVREIEAVIKRGVVFDAKKRVQLLQGIAEFLKK